MDTPGVASSQPPRVVTPWYSEDATRHEVFKNYVLGLIEDVCPWVLIVAKAADAQVLACQGAVYLSFPAHPEQWVPIPLPALRQALMLLPWSESQDVAH